MVACVRAVVRWPQLSDTAVMGVMPFMLQVRTTHSRTHGLTHPSGSPSVALALVNTRTSTRLSPLSLPPLSWTAPPSTGPQDATWGDQDGWEYVMTNGQIMPVYNEVQQVRPLPKCWNPPFKSLPPHAKALFNFCAL